MMKFLTATTIKDYNDAISELMEQGYARLYDGYKETLLSKDGNEITVKLDGKVGGKK